MAWSTQQIQQVKRYQRWAKIGDEEYRNRLQKLSGCGARSSTVESLSQGDFDLFMAHLETVLARNVAEAVCSKPAGIRLDYWRSRLPQAGRPNTRQIHEIYKLWDELKIYLPSDVRTPDELHAIAGKAIGQSVTAISGDNGPTAKECVAIIEALRDRLKWQKKRVAKEAAAAAVPPLNEHHNYTNDIPF